MINGYQSGALNNGHIFRKGIIFARREIYHFHGATNTLDRPWKTLLNPPKNLGMGQSLLTFLAVPGFQKCLVKLPVLESCYFFAVK